MSLSHCDPILAVESQRLRQWRVLVLLALALAALGAATSVGQRTGDAFVAEHSDHESELSCQRLHDDFPTETTRCVVNQRGRRREHYTSAPGYIWCTVRDFYDTLIASSRPVERLCGQRSAVGLEQLCQHGSVRATR